MKKTELRLLSIEDIITLRRNPQYLTPTQMESLKRSINRDGFCAPILVRPLSKSKFEIISGNHRFMAASELGMTEIPCVIAEMSDSTAQRLAINLNTIHGEPNAELLAPFLAELDEITLADIYVEDSMKRELLAFDASLEKMLAMLEPPKAMNRNSSGNKNAVCVCPICQRKHFIPSAKE